MKTVKLLLIVLSVSLWGSSPYEINLLEDQRTKTVLEFILFDYKLETVSIEGKQCTKVIVPGHLSVFMEKGYPELPRFAKSIIVPDEGEINFKILQLVTEEVDVHPILPSKGNLKRNVNPEEIPYEFGDFYTKDAWFPENTIEISKPFILREFRGVTVYFHPFQFNPSENKLRIVKRILVEVYKEREGGENTLQRNRLTITKPFIEIYKNFFLNYHEARQRYPQLRDTVGNMLIITKDAYYNNIIPFAKWKKKIGIPVKVVRVSSIGNNPISIKNYIQQEYNTNGVTWIILVGNAEDVATIPGVYDETCDPVYTWLAGNDRYFDAFISRFSANNATHVDIQIWKTINYEKNPFTMDPSGWLSRACGTASDEGTPTDCQRLDWVTDTLLSYTYTYADELCSPTATDQMILNALSQGRSILNHIGHGNRTGFGANSFWIDINEIATLTNTNKLIFGFFVACLVGDFDDVPVSLCEQWMWTGNIQNPRGGVAAFGASILQSWIPPTIAQLHAMGLLKREEATTIGGICFNGSMYMYEQTGDLEVLESWHIFGDASLDLRTKTPDSLEVVHPQFLPPTPQQLSVQVFHEDGVTPLANALVCVWIPSQEPEIHLSGYTDNLGHITFHIQPQNPLDTVFITVTKHNYFPYEGFAIVVPPQGAYIVRGFSTFSDSLGNNNGVINPGELIQLTTFAKNIGSEPAYGVFGILSSNNINILQDSSWFGDIPQGDSTLGNPPYIFEIPTNTQNNQTISINLNFFDYSGNIWQNIIFFRVYKPVVTRVREFIVNDNNSNGILEPNEQGNLIVVIRNDGGDRAQWVNTKLLSLSPFIVVLDSLASYYNIQPGDSSNNLQDPFVLFASPNTPTAHMANLLFIIQTEYDCDTLQFSLVIGKKHYFVWDPDPNHTSGPIIDSILEALNYIGDYNTSLQNFSPNLYMCLFVCAGIYPNNHIIRANSQEAITIVNFIQGGGRVYLEGGDVWYYDPRYMNGYDFGNLFGIFAVADGSGDFGPASGISGTFTQGMYFPGYVNENSWIDRIQAQGLGAFNIILDANQGYYAAVARDFGNYRTVGASFELAGLLDGSPPSRRSVLLDSIMRFFGINIVDVKEEIKEPSKITEFRGVFPNPIDRSGEIVFVLKDKKPVSLKIYNALGRIVEEILNNQDLDPGVHKISLDLFHQPSGIYFVEFKTDDFKKIVKILKTESKH